MSKEVFDVVIIGGGLTGLTAAVTLAQKGKKVAVLEKGKNLGGRGSSKEVSGAIFNLGPHALYKKGDAIRILKNLGIRVEGGTPNLHGKLYAQDTEYDLPSTFLSVLRTKYLNMKEKKEFIYLMLNIGKNDQTKWFSQTLKEWVECNVHSEKNQELLYALCRLSSYINAPELVSAAPVLNQLKISLGGALYVNRGWKSIIDQLREKAIQLGVTIVPDSTVENLNMINNPCVITYKEKTETKQVYSEWVISTAPPKETHRMIEHVQQTQLGQILKDCIPIKAACLDVVLNHLPHPHHDFALDINQSLYYSNHSKSAKLSYHPQHQVIHVMKYLGTDEEADAENIVISFLEKNQPGWMEHHVMKRFLPRIIVSHRIPTVGAPDAMESAQREFPRLLLAGEWVSNEALLAEAAAQTAIKAAEQILANKGYEKN